MLFARSILPRLIQLGARPIGQFITESATNAFRLPVRLHDRVFIWFARWDALRDEDEFARQWSRVSGWRDEIDARLLPAFMRQPERLRLVPTERSDLS